ncbi:TatD family hydrolase [Candidatus Uhrbacteria bacterium]|nr:TatD family hydrolase [Candidatus Uhrbacteria bacterium]
MLFDTHCHVQFHSYKNDMDEVIKRTLEKGVFMITVGTQSDTSRTGLEVAEKYEGVWASIGLHPYHLHKQEFADENETVHTRTEKFDLDLFRKLAQHPKCIAVGECGLDYFHMPPNVDREEVIREQKETVRAQFDLTTEMNLPVIIHCRDAYEDQLEMVEEYVKEGKLARRGVVHCFVGTQDIADRFLDLGFYISFTGILTFPPRKSEKGEDGLSPIQRIAKNVPLERLLVETDAPYLTPVPYRGERNEPWMVQFVAEKIAELKGIDVDEVERVTTENAKKLFLLSF